jgi:hypothetical protein
MQNKLGFIFIYPLPSLSLRLLTLGTEEAIYKVYLFAEGHANAGRQLAVRRTE